MLQASYALLEIILNSYVATAVDIPQDAQQNVAWVAETFVLPAAPRCLCTTARHDTQSTDT
jgi:hypothetical protein